jgi:hypothetical protein
MKAAGAGGAGVMKGRAARTVAGERAMSKLAKRPTPVKPVPKVKLGAEPDKARMLRNMTNPGIRQAYATQGGKAMSPLNAKKVARSQATAEAARKFYGTSSRDRPKPAAKPAQGKAAPKANDRAMRAAKNYQRAAGAMGRGAMNKRTDVSLATASRALDVYRGKPITGKRSGFTSSGKATKPAAKPTVYRTRSQAAAAQTDRKRQVAEIGARLPKVGAAQSLSRRAVKVNQGNLLTGRVEKVTANVTTNKGSSKIGESSFARKTQRRMGRVEGRIDALVSARRSLPQRPRRPADQAAAIKIDRRLSKMSQAADTYRSARPKARRK